jgi:hypothetical protein
MRLDCETPELAEEALALILEMDRLELRSLLAAIKSSDFQIETDTETDRLLPMLRQVAGRQIDDMQEGETCWFHATRTGDFSSFRHGILPLPQNVDRIWSSLYSLVHDCLSPDEWVAFRRETVESNYGGHAQEVIDCWMANLGPYAFLFAGSALNPSETGNHDYLGKSELAEFIALYFERQHGIDLLGRYQAATRPALIKFMTSGIKAADLGAALNYLLYHVKGWSKCNIDPNYSGEGRRIEPHQIVKAIPVLEAGRRFRNQISYCLSPMGDHVSLLP